LRWLNAWLLRTRLPHLFTGGFGQHQSEQAATHHDGEGEIRSLLASPVNQVLDLLIARSKKADIVALRGNHEIVMKSFLRGRIPFDDWRLLGGLATILSYGVVARILLEKGDIQPRDLASTSIPAPLQAIGSQ
jgi:hypothetical protein